MILIKPSFEILTKLGWDGGVHHGQDMVARIEIAGRTCYKSEDKITSYSAERFVKRIIESGHHSVLEHENISVKIICDRGVTHEIVRHRLVAYSQESTRYCNYKGGVTFVIPPWIDIPEGIHSVDTSLMSEETDASQEWLVAMKSAEDRYISLLLKGWSPQQARSVLPNSLKTEIVMTANIREWRHILKLRTSNAAHPQMREIMVPLLAELSRLLPILFDNL
jgi:thymidylate synthase (FAD)